MKEVMAKQAVDIIDDEGQVDNDLELRVIKDEDGQYIIKAFYFNRYIHDDIYSYHAGNTDEDLEDAISTMRSAELDYHLENPDLIGNTDKFDIRCG